MIPSFFRRSAFAALFLGATTVAFGQGGAGGGPISNPRPLRAQDVIAALGYTPARIGTISTSGSGGLTFVLAGESNLYLPLSGTLLTTTGSGATLTALNASQLATGTVPAARLPVPGASTLGGVKSLAATSHQFLTSIGTDGTPVAAQPSAADIAGLVASATTDTTNASNIVSGTLPAARLPTPTVSTLGGVQSATAPLNQWMTGISTAGAPQFSQPTFANIGGTLNVVAGTSTLSGATNGNGLLYNSGSVVTNLASANNGVLVTNGSGVPSISSTVPYGNLPFGVPVSPARPDTVWGFFSLTTTAGSTSLTLGGASFTSGDVGKYLICTGAGPTEGRLVTTITAVGSSTTITTAAPATQAMSAVSQQCYYGSDQSANIQAAFDYGRANGIGSYVQGGVYLVAAGLTCLPAASKNSQNASGSMCQFDPGAHVIAVAPMTSVVTYGSGAIDYSGILRSATVGGGTIDGGFVADYAVDMPFYSVVSRVNQTTKNTKRAGVRWGNVSAPATSGGSQDINVNHLRDVTYVTVTGITTGATTTVTTQWDHGYATGRVVTLVGAAFTGGTPPPNRFYRITVTGARTFTLDNTDSSSWGTFSGTARVALTMPSMRVPSFVSGITNANPGVVTTAQPHSLANGTQVWLADMTGITLGGVYCARSPTSTTFQLYQSDCTTAVNTTALGAYSAAGSVIEHLDPTTVEKGIYYENGIDGDIITGQISGARIGVYANPAASGYDGKLIKVHFWNYNENGELLTAVSMGGDNTFSDVQIDLPVRYGFELSGPGNSIIGSRLNYGAAGVLVGYNNYASFVRLNGGAAVVQGGGIKGDATNAVLGEVSVNGSSYGSAPGYTRLSLEARYVSLVQPNSVASSLFVRNLSGGASHQVIGNGSAAMMVYDSAAGRGGMYISSQTSAATAALNTMDANGNYVGTPALLSGNTFTATGNFAASAMSTPNGLLYNNAGYLGNLATAPNGVLVTDGSGVPSISAAGLSVTKTVRNSAGTGTCTLVFSSGLLTGGTC